MENFALATQADISRVEFNGEPVLTTEQLAQCYECSPRNIQDNFDNNRDRFIEGKHFYKLTGNDLREFKSQPENFGLANKFASSLYLWTKRGAARHCKSVGTDTAWAVFEMLEENYFTPRRIVDTTPGAPFDFERGIALAKLVPHTKDAYTKQRLIAKAANLILGEDFLPVPPPKYFQDDIQLKLFFHGGN